MYISPSCSRWPQLRSGRNPTYPPPTSSLASQERYYSLKKNQEEERKWLLMAVRKYLEVVNGPKFQAYAKMGQCLFYLSYLLIQTKREDQARVFFKRLIKDYPQSPYLPHAYLSFGDHFFEAADFENADKFYDKALRYKGSPVEGYALYKKGWVAYTRADYQKAFRTFAAVIWSGTTRRQRCWRSSPASMPQARS